MGSCEKSLAGIQNYFAHRASEKRRKTMRKITQKMIAAALSVAMIGSMLPQVASA